jgi:hypothetical protein
LERLIWWSSHSQSKSFGDCNTDEYMVLVLKEVLEVIEDVVGVAGKEGTGR